MNHPKLVWARTDGSPSRWPSENEQQPSARKPWHEKLVGKDAKIELYQTKVGDFLAEDLGLPKRPGGGHYSIPLPDGYALFAHNKPQENGSIRTDVYLFGSNTASKFRSPAEFFEHARWLQDTRISLSDHSKCGCKYNQTSELHSLGKSSYLAPGPSSASLKRSGTPTGHDRARTKPRTESSASPEDLRPAVVPEREKDMIYSRRFRRGELVWFKIDPIVPPSDQLHLPMLTHWPGLVSNIVMKTLVDPPPSNGSTSAPSDADMPRSAVATAWSIAGAQPPPGIPQQAKKYLEYHLRPLGLFAQASEVLTDPRDLLPYALGVELLGGSAGWDKLGKECNRVISEGVKAEVSEMRAKSGAPAGGIRVPEMIELQERWKKQWATRVPFKGSSTEWGVRVFRLGIALKTAAAITSSWTQTDKIENFREDEVNPADWQLIKENKKTLYQGLWWGGERIWLDDMVRLKKKRSELPSEGLAEPSEGANERAVFLRISNIALEPYAPSDKESDKQSWRCLCYGDVYELAVAAGDSDSLENNPFLEGEVPLTSGLIAPKGYTYRQLNDTGSEVTADIMDVAGRVYPDLFEPKTQKWYAPTDVEEDKLDGRHRPGEAALALCGLRPGMTVASKSEKWKEDLYGIVSEATKSVEEMMRGHYAKLLSSEIRRTNPAVPRSSSDTSGAASNGTSGSDSLGNGTAGMRNEGVGAGSASTAIAA